MREFTIALALTALAGFASGSTESVKLDVTGSTSPTPGHVTVTIRNQVLAVPIPPLASASHKRDLIQAALTGAGYLVTNDGPLGSALTIHGLSRRDTVQFATENSGEVLDALHRSTVGLGEVRFASVGPFQPFDPGLQPAIFTAGIVTDVGELSAQVSAQELNFQTDGPIICQALFQRLAPRAPQYGAQINYAGDRLEVYFDPAYTVTQGGIVFGTTSPTPGCAGSVESEDQKRRAELRVGDSTNPVPAPMEVGKADAGGTTTTGVQVPPQTPAPILRDLLLPALQDGGFPAFLLPDPTELLFVDLSPRSLLTVWPRGTGQAELVLGGPGVSGGRVGFAGPFVPFDSGGQPAIFTAGIVTDVGTLTERVSAQELSFQTDGPIICQALFQRLAPRAPQYGAQINYAGDRLEVYFDPAYTVTQGGIVFGTTSPAQGSSGTVIFTEKIRKR